MRGDSGAGRCARIRDSSRPGQIFGATSSFSSGAVRIARWRSAMRRRSICCWRGGFVVNANAIVQLLLFVGVLLALVWPLGTYMARVYQGQSVFGLDRLIGPVERLIYRMSGVRASDEMNWKTYATAV